MVTGLTKDPFPTVLSVPKPRTRKPDSTTRPEKRTSTISSASSSSCRWGWSENSRTSTSRRGVGSVGSPVPGEGIPSSRETTDCTPETPRLASPTDSRVPDPNSNPPRRRGTYTLRMDPVPSPSRAATPGGVSGTRVGDETLPHPHPPSGRLPTFTSVITPRDEVVAPDSVQEGCPGLTSELREVLREGSLKTVREVPPVTPTVLVHGHSSRGPVVVERGHPSQSRIPTTDSGHTHVGRKLCRKDGWPTNGNGHGEWVRKNNHFCRPTMDRNGETGQDRHRYRRGTWSAFQTEPEVVIVGPVPHPLPRR